MKKLQTLRCCLSKISKADQQDMERLYTSAQTRKFLGGALSAQAAREKIDRLILDREEIFAVRLKENGALLGLVYLNPYYDTPACELSYEFLPEFWGQGYACEVLSALLRARAGRKRASGRDTAKKHRFPASAGKAWL